MKLDFKNLKSRRRVDYTLKSAIQMSHGMERFKVFESNIDPVLRLMHRTGIQSTGWLNSGDSCVQARDCPEASTMTAILPAKVLVNCTTYSPLPRS